MARYYAVTRTMHAGTGALELEAQSWKRGSPMVEVVKRVLRTQKGMFIPDPNFGVDYRGLDRNHPRAASQFITAVGLALKRYIDAKQLSDLEIRVDPLGDRFLYELRFRDPRLGTTAALRGEI